MTRLTILSIQTVPEINIDFIYAHGFLPVCFQKDKLEQLRDEIKRHYNVNEVYFKYRNDETSIDNQQ